MFIRAYLPQIFSALFGGLFVFLGIATFGNALAFDRIYVSLLIFTGVICRKDINVVSVIIILVLQLMWEGLAWNILVDENLVKVIFYLAALYAVFYFRYDWLAKMVATIVIIATVSEVYWYLNDYSAPEIYWYIWIMISNLFIRHLVFCRVSFVDRYYPRKGESVNLDWVIYKFNAALTILQAAMVFEYLSRHLLGFDEVLIVYYSYSYIIHIIGTITLWAIFTESSKRLIPKLLKA
jgi:hypothetical protein